MSEIVLRKLEEADWSLLEEWFEEAEFSRRLGGMLPLPQFLRYTRDSESAQAWLACESMDTSWRAVGAVFCETIPERSRVRVLCGA